MIVVFSLHGQKRYMGYLHHIFIYYMMKISDTNLRQFICVMFKMQTPSEIIQYKYFLTDVSV